MAPAHQADQVSRYQRRPDDFLSPEELAALTPAIVAERVKALKPLIAAHARQAEEKRMPVDEIWHALRRSGLFYLVMGKKYGGLEASFDEVMDAVLPICEADPSLGWLAAFCVMNPRSVASFSKQAQDEVFGDGKCLLLTTIVVPPGRARKEEGGYRVSGRWQWGTTIQVTDWVTLACAIEDDGASPAMATFLLPAEDVWIEDTWSTYGMVATGTHHVIAEDVFVPDYRVNHAWMFTPAWQARAREAYDYPLFLATIYPALSVTVALPVIGAAKGSIALARDWALKHTRRGTATPDSQRTTTKIRLANAESLTHAAELLLRDGAREIYGAVNLPPAEQEEANLRARAHVAKGVSLAREAVLSLSESAGTSLHFLEEPFQRTLRDVIVGASQVSVDYDACMEAWGSFLLGIPSEDRVIPKSATPPPV